MGQKKLIAKSVIKPGKWNALNVKARVKKSVFIVMELVKKPVQTVMAGVIHNVVSVMEKVVRLVITVMEMGKNQMVIGVPFAMAKARKCVILVLVEDTKTAMNVMAKGRNGAMIVMERVIMNVRYVVASKKSPVTNVKVKDFISKNNFKRGIVNISVISVSY